MNKIVFQIPNKPIEVHLIGAGGTGSALIGPLKQMAIALPRLGNHPGLDVTVWDPDTVSPANIGRQDFAPADIGRSKAAVLVNRINLSYGLRWKAEPRTFDRSGVAYRDTVLLGAVDTRKARASIYEAYRHLQDGVWIDCGNSARTGQVIMGVRQRGRAVAPCVAQLFPEIVDIAGDAEDNLPSCSVAEALARQDLMTNRKIADEAATLLWLILRYGEVEHHGAFIDVARGRSTPVPVDPEYWRSLGWELKTSAKAA